MQQKFYEHRSIEVRSLRAEAQQLMEETDVEELVEDLEEKLPEK